MIDLILDECLNEIRAGRATLAECLAKYPEQANELAPLLELGSALTQVSDVKPSPAFQQATRARLLQLPQQSIRRKRRGWVPTLLAIPRLKIAAVALVLLIALIGASGGAVAASSESLPGSWLYPVKRASEQVQLVLAPDPASQANVHLQMANDRLNETVALSQSGQDQLAQQTLDEYNVELSRTLEIIATPSNANPALIENLTKGLIKQREKLRSIKNPRAEEQALRRALSISEKALEKIAPSSPATPTAPPVSPTTIQPTVMTQPQLTSVTESPALATPPVQITLPTKGKAPTSETLTAPEPPATLTLDKGKTVPMPKGKPTPKQK